MRLSYMQHIEKINLYIVCLIDSAVILLVTRMWENCYFNNNLICALGLRVLRTLLVHCTSPG
jgi:hypothetical protein